ncbi:hypothetical protein P691DRAFT_46715 [Macrolepiota fuliginosa MF-IS2]|uniref:Uncharacterized protein n=1 Tax=Macrolepiota fuliginosa MF-IS2 TaxID=1400762 RepID=A0A9P5XFU9_9AGAR|nr:hypothetical protein P691DRAFT_46715 [Macrolepiota fuliginosa MF-IS2]
MPHFSVPVTNDNKVAAQQEPYVEGRKVHSLHSQGPVCWAGSRFVGWHWNNLRRLFRIPFPYSKYSIYHPGLSSPHQKPNPWHDAEETGYHHAQAGIPRSATSIPLAHTPHHVHREAGSVPSRSRGKEAAPMPTNIRILTKGMTSSAADALDDILCLNALFLPDDECPRLRLFELNGDTVSNCVWLPRAVIGIVGARGRMSYGFIERTNIPLSHCFTWHKFSSVGVG